jgi:hypothetical protein
MAALVVVTIAAASAGCSHDLPDLSSLIKDGTYLSPDGKAKLTVNGYERILKLSGSNREMGYNYGTLLGTEIVAAIQHYIFWIMDEEGLTYREVADTLDAFVWDPAYLAELEGMLQGMNDALDKQDRIVQPRGEAARPVCLDDLKIAHVLADFDCSSFAVWGKGRRDSSLLIARNLDYKHDQQDIVKRLMVIISYDSDNAQRWVSAGICGYTGCLTGFNSSGVSAFIHSTNEFPSTDTTGIYPRGLLLRKIIETMDGSNTPADVEAMLDSAPARVGNNFLVCFPRQDRAADGVAGVIEYDGAATHADGRATLRSPSDNPTLPADAGHDQRLGGSEAIINTNHYLKRSGEIPTSGTTSVDRYLSVKAGLLSAQADGDVDLDEARDMMRAVKTGGTLHTVILEPEVMRLHLFLAEPGRSAPDCRRIDFHFDELF